MLHLKFHQKEPESIQILVKEDKEKKSKGVRCPRRRTKSIIEKKEKNEQKNLEKKHLLYWDVTLI